MSALLTLLALLFEAMLGYPERLVSRAIGHPVMWMGGLIGALDRWLNREGATPWQRQGGGVLALSILILVVRRTVACSSSMVSCSCPSA